MALTYGFYNSLNGDRTYNAEQMGSMFDGIINDGIFASIGDKFNVSSVSGMTIKVGSGRAWFDGTWTYNDSDLLLIVSKADTSYSRIDSVFIKVDKTDSIRANSIVIVEGTAVSSPSAPTPTDTATCHYYRIANITVGKNVTSITNANINNSPKGKDVPWVTGPLSVISTKETLERWEKEFTEWFENLENQLTTNQATNLQRQITQITNNTVSDYSNYLGDVNSRKYVLSNLCKYFDTPVIVEQNRYLNFTKDTIVTMYNVEVIPTGYIITGATVQVEGSVVHAYVDQVATTRYYTYLWSTNTESQTLGARVIYTLRYVGTQSSTFMKIYTSDKGHEYDFLFNSYSKSYYVLVVDNHPMLWRIVRPVDIYNQLDASYGVFYISRDIYIEFFELEDGDTGAIVKAASFSGTLVVNIIPIGTGYLL